MEGWVKIHRCLVDNDLWHSEPFSRGQAWVDLIILANHKESFFYKRGNKVVVKRGQIGRSEVELSDRWRWSRTKVRKFLIELEKEQQIILHKSTITQLITIVNYDVYQEKEQQTGQQKDSRKTTKEQQKDTYKNDKNDNNEKNEEEEKYIYLAEFQKIAKGEITRATELDKNFHFGLFKKEWSENFQNEIFKFWRHLEKKKGDSWGIIGTLTGQLDAIKSFLNKFSELEIIESFDKTRMDGNVSWNPEWVKNQKDKDKPKEPQGFAYELPPFQNAKQREWWFFQKFEFYKTLEILENRLINTTYYKLAYEKRQPEKLIQQLETEFPILLQHQFKNDRWQNIQ